MQKIVVENFKGIQNAEIEIRDMVVLIGEQASGKSTLAKLVYFFKSLGDVYLDFISDRSIKWSASLFGSFAEKLG